MTVVGVEDRTGWGPRIRVWGVAARPFVGVLVVLLWIAWAVLAWALEPRSVSADQVRADIASGQILTYRVTGLSHTDDAWLPSAGGDGWDTLGLDEMTGLPDEERYQQPATGILYWVDAPFAQTRHFDANDLQSPGLPADPSVSYRGLVQEMRAGGVPLTTVGPDQVPNLDLPFWPGWAALLLGFGSILLGYRPTRATRWGWFWLVYLVPAGLGLVALAVSDLIRPRSASVAVGPADEKMLDENRLQEKPVEDRLRGGRAFLLGVVLALLIGVTAGEISRGTSSLWIP